MDVGIGLPNGLLDVEGPGVPLATHATSTKSTASPTLLCRPAFVTPGASESSRPAKSR
jgi:hypothetical protein